MTNSVAEAREFPSRDAKSYVGTTGFVTLFAVADAIDAIDKPVSDIIADWLKSAPGFHTPTLIAIVDRLSRRAASHDACLTLAVHAETRIVRDTYTSSRISSYGALARAVWRVDPEEASAYFRRALDLADAVGSDDFDRTNHLLELTSAYRGPPLSPPTAYSLGRILELNQSDDGKFPWIEYAQTMVPIAGLTALTMISRLDDRGQARLSLSLGPMLTQLCVASLVQPDIAVCLFGLAEPSESWTWRIYSFVKAVLPNLPAAKREWLFETVLHELDRDDQLSPWRETIEGLIALGEFHLPPGSLALRRMHIIAERRRVEESVLQQPREVAEIPLFHIDVGDADAIDEAIERDQQESTGKPWPEQTLSHIAAGIAGPVDRLRFIRALVQTNSAQLSAKLRALQDHLPRWRDNSVGLRDALPGLALELAAKHAAELVGHSWEAAAGWRELTKTFNADCAEIAERIIGTLGPTAVEISGDSWLALAAKIAPKVGDAAFAHGLERHLSLSGATIPQEVGDGPWCQGLAIANDPAAAAAGLIWARLGHFRAAVRWRAAHAIRRLCAVSRADIVAQIVGLYDSTTAGAFGSATLPFYPMHARLWLLIALARAAVDYPETVVPHRAVLENAAFNTDFPHVLIRAFAADALAGIIPALDAADATVLRIRLEAVNTSPFEHRPRTGLFAEHHQNRPEGKARPENAFHLDYQFNKSQANRLSHTFGCPAWEIEDAVTRWVRQWDGTVRGMYDCPRLGSDRYDEGSWSSGSMPTVDRYGGYLGWHALMLVAGEMLATRPVTGQSWNDNAWDDFLRQYRLSRPDGLWLSDATDLFPLDLPAETAMPESDGRPIEPGDHALLLPLIGDLQRDGRIVVKGSMSLPQDITISINSVIASRLDAQATVLTILTDPKFFRWLPDEDEEIARHFRAKGNTVRAWLKSGSQTERQLDRQDPYATTTALRRPLPADWVTTDFELAPADDIVRTWAANGCEVFFAEAWGAEGGRGETHWDQSGERLSVSKAFLTSFLQKNDEYLVFAIKAQKYRKGNASGRLGDTSGFTHRSTVFTMGSGGVIWTPKQIPRRVAAAVKLLETRDRREFNIRFAVIRASLERKR